MNEGGACGFSDVSYFLLKVWPSSLLFSAGFQLGYIYMVFYATSVHLSGRSCNYHICRRLNVIKSPFLAECPPSFSAQMPQLSPHRLPWCHFASKLRKKKTKRRLQLRHRLNPHRATPLHMNERADPHLQ